MPFLAEREQEIQISHSSEGLLAGLGREHREEEAISGRTVKSPVMLLFCRTGTYK